jgi:signal transduction histidine kinase
LGLFFCAASSGEEIPLSALSELQLVTRKDLTTPREVRFRAVVSVFGEGLLPLYKNAAAYPYFYVEDGQAALFVSIQAAKQAGLWEGTPADIQALREGAEVEIAGELVPGRYAPRIYPRTVKVLGQKPLEPPLEPDPAELMNGGIRSRRLRLKGVVQDVTQGGTKDQWVVSVETGRGKFYVYLPKNESYSPTRLLDAEVQITGAATIVSNWRRELMSMRLMPGREEDVVVLAPPPADPFSAEKLPLDQLGTYTPGGRPKRRRCIEGTVTYVSDAFLVVQENGCAVRVNLNAALREKVQVGDRVEAAGFIDFSRKLGDLSGAVVRKIGAGQPPSPVSVTMTGILKEFENLKLGNFRLQQPAGYEGLLVEATGRLLSRQSRSNGVQTLEIDCGDAISTATLSGAPLEVPVGSLLRLTGVAELQYRHTPHASLPVRLDLLVRNATDVRVLFTPPWWTPERSRAALLGVLAMALAASAWAVALRRTVKKRTRQLAEEIRGRRDAAIEFEAALKERSRLAANLHDTVLQTVTGLGLQIKASEIKAAELEDSTLASALGLAWRMAHRCQEDLRDSVWALNALPIKERDITEAIRKLALQTTRGHRVPVHVDAGENLPVLADFVAGNLLLIVQEAIHNAIKHGVPDTIRVSLASVDAGARLAVTVHDNGSGFRPGSEPGTDTGHFGLQGMKGRAERLEGKLEIESAPGHGTILRVEVPVHSFDKHLS